MSAINRVPSPLAAPFQPGGFLARAAAPLLEKFLPTSLTEVVVRSGPGRGLRLLIDAQTEKFYWTGAHERAVQRTFQELVHPGEVVWDVGAHIGFFSLIAGRLVGPTGYVHAFEPMAANRARLTAALDMNEAGNIRVHGCALGATSGERILYASHASAMWTLVAERAEGGGEPISCTTLDEVSASAPSPGLIKVDTEGAEVDVLRGGIDLIAKHRPRFLVEFQNEYLVDEALRVLHGYDCVRVDVDHWLFV